MLNSNKNEFYRLSTTQKPKFFARKFLLKEIKEYIFGTVLSIVFCLSSDSQRKHPLNSLFTLEFLYSPLYEMLTKREQYSEKREHAHWRNLTVKGSNSVGRVIQSWAQQCSVAKPGHFGWSRSRVEGPAPGYSLDEID